MTRRFSAILGSVSLVATLGACHQGQKAGHGEVSGQILPGSVSDAMLPYDAVKSKAPLAPKETIQSGNDGDVGSAADSADTAVAADPATPDVAASPASAASVAN